MRPTAHAAWARESYSEDDLALGLRFSVISLFTNLAMGSLKFGVGMLSGSQALMAGALYSVNDVLSSIAVNISLRFSRRKPSEQFPYGFERAEFMATGITGVVLAVAVSGVFVYQIKDILTLHTGPVHITALGVAVLSIFVSGHLFYRGHHLAHALPSPALHTTADHCKADAISSVAVVIGIGAATLDFHLIDRFIAVFEIGHIMVLAGEFLVASGQGLMDRSLPEQDLSTIRHACGEVAGVEGVASLRTRQGGRYRWVELLVIVSPDLSVSEARRIADQTVRAVGEALGPDTNVRVSYQATRVRSYPSRHATVS